MILNGCRTIPVQKIEGGRRPFLKHTDTTKMNNLQDLQFASGMVKKATADIGRLTEEIKRIKLELEVEDEHISDGDPEEVIAVDVEIARLNEQRDQQLRKYGSKIERLQSMIDAIRAEMTEKVAYTDMCIEQRKKKIREPKMTKRQRKLSKQIAQKEQELEHAHAQQQKYTTQLGKSHVDSTPALAVNFPQNVIVQQEQEQEHSPKPKPKLVRVKPPTPKPSAPASVTDETENEGGEYCKAGHNCESYNIDSGLCPRHERQAQKKVLKLEGKDYYRFKDYFFEINSNGSVGKHAASVFLGGRITFH